MVKTEHAGTDTPPKTRILLLYTGGTIGMAPRDPLNSASPLDPQPIDALMEYVPGVQQMGIDIVFEAFDPPLDSSDVKPKHWATMARVIRDYYDTCDGFVVLHGTDTMAYTTSALAFILEDLAKPVVVTGSQLPISYARTDAIQNLVPAIYIAGYKATGLPHIREVVLCFANKILRGCRATKVSNEDWAGFDSPNFPPLGTIGEHIKINEALFPPVPPKRPSGSQAKLGICEAIGDMAGAVLDIGLFPGFTDSQLAAVLAVPDVQGAVLRTFGAGNAPGDMDLTKLKAVIDPKEGEGCVVVNTTQCLKGTVEMGRYAASSGLLEHGVVSGLDMTKEAALAKLYWTLATQMGEERSKQLQINQRGEQSESLFDLRYGSCGDSDEPVAAFKKSLIPDPRLDRNRLSRAVVRMAGLNVAGVKEGDSVAVRVFMNKIDANEDTPIDDGHFLAELNTVWTGKEETLIAEAANLDDARSAMGDGNIILSVIPMGGVKIWFRGLYLALFAKARF